MLVLSRRPNESVVINGNIVITIGEIQRDRVRIGIEAPPEVNILRAELLERDRQAGKPAHAKVRAKSYRILVVDDDEVDRLTYRRCLRASLPQQFVLTESGLGKEGLDRCQQEKPDCVLLDYRLPDITGFQFLEALHQNGGGHIPVVLITGLKGDQIKTDSLAHGAQGFLAKRDISPESLRAEIFEAMCVQSHN